MADSRIRIPLEAVLECDLVADGTVERGQDGELRAGYVIRRRRVTVLHPGGGELGSLTLPDGEFTVAGDATGFLEAAGRLSGADVSSSPLDDPEARTR